MTVAFQDRFYSKAQLRPLWTVFWVLDPTIATDQKLGFRFGFGRGGGVCSRADLNRGNLQGKLSLSFVCLKIGERYTQDPARDRTFFLKRREEERVWSGH